MLAEVEQDGPFVLEVGEDDRRPLVHPADLTEAHLEALVDLRYWLAINNLSWIPWRKAEEVWALWKQHHGIPDVQACTRLRFLVDRYFSSIEVDFARHYPGLDAGELWRARRWRRLLNLIDHLPRNSFYSQSVLDDPEHMAMLDRVKEKGGSGPPPLPALATWSAEVDKLADVNDTLLLIRDTLIRANVDKQHQNTVPPIKWTARPGRREQDKAVDKITREEREARHKKAVALFLSPKAESDD